jgi:DNA polymerase III alpha subunit
MMEECLAAAHSWQTYFPDYLVCVDMSVATPDFGSYAQFDCALEKAFLFCACKHREGSDIPRLDGCVFLDKVEDRNAKTFVQCMGRVLRLDKDGRKTFGWVLDCCAQSSYQMCERIHTYLSPHAKLDVFPWTYTFDTQPQPTGSLRTVHHLCMQTQPSDVATPIIYASRQDIIHSFQRSIPDDERYHQRVAFELDVLEKRNLFSYLKQACHILEWTKSIPHVTRGSCGSSLVCYLLGISHVDPVYYGISFARFTSEMRTSLPDIDFDFPYHLRDQVFLALELHWPGKIARISNHVFFHDKSSTRQALRDMGMRGFIAKEDMKKTLNALSPDKKTEFDTRKHALNDTFRGYMLHCGGITYYADGVPTELILPHSHGMIPQISLNKIDVANEKRFKIDILSSRGLAQLHECAKFKTIQFHVDDDDIDQDTMDMLCRGDSLGITQGETCLMRQAFRLIQPRTIEHIAMCLAIIRPVAKESRKEDVEEIKDHEWLVFDDDAITLIADLFKCSEAEADVYRRHFAKRDKKGMSEFKKRLKKMTLSKEKIQQLKNLHLYSFCKSHAFSYAQMVYHLAYYKCHYPKRFWRATLNHVESSYAKWVHLYEATCAGVDTRFKVASNYSSIYAQHRRKGIHGLSPIQQLRKYGYWDMSDNSFFPGCFRFIKNGSIFFYGVIACKRVSRSKKAVVYIGVGPREYMTLHIPKWFGKAKAVIIKGSGKGNIDAIECETYTLI